MPGQRADYNPNPYIAKHQSQPQSSVKDKVGGGRVGKVYELGPSSMKGGIFGPPEKSSSRGGKAARFNPASGTYTTERPF